MGIEASMQRFANPGWEGHWPLQICNHGKFNVKIFPGSDIVQIAYIMLDKSVEHDYSTGPYQYDDGGPSKWWLDESIRNICRNISGDYQNVFDNMLNNVPSKYKLQVAIRLEKFVNKSNIPPKSLEYYFKKSEKRKKIFSDFCKKTCNIPPFTGAIVDIFAFLFQAISLKLFFSVLIVCSLYFLLTYIINSFFSERWYYTDSDVELEAKESK